MITEPKWRSLLANTTQPIFNSQQCQDIINMGHQQKAEEARVGHRDGSQGKYDTKKRITTISWIPFSKMPEMYKIIERTMKQVNGNHFGYEGMTLTEPAQFTEYPKGGFYDWHMDAEVNCQFEPPVRKISMTILLSPHNEFEGGNLEFMSEGNQPPQLLQGQAIFFCSMIRHRVAKVKKGMRRSLVMWFGGPPFK
jgi:PKHD-type hydroxylase|tara:strand:+ start:5272 stop:5856 length:585 start_codon:yes stop_codon:yes gene_type:complete